MKFIESYSPRLLIADEVGLGKTIEAGLIMRELKARHELSRVLIVCPSNLADKWRFELWNRFEEDFSILNSAKMREFIADYDRKGDAAFLKGICPLQSLRSRSVSEELEAASVPFDLVVVDEAHHMRNPPTLSHRVGRILSETAEAMVLLTATPIHLGNQDLFNLLRVLQPDEFENLALFQSSMDATQHVNATLRLLQADPPELGRCRNELSRVEETAEASRYQNNPYYKDVLARLEETGGASRRAIVELQRDVNRLHPLAHVLSRTRKRDTGTYAKRTPVDRRPEFTKAEMDFYNAVTEFSLMKYTQRPELGTFAAFITMMPQRQVASCIQAMVRYYEDRRSDLQRDLDELSDLSPEDFNSNEPDNEGLGSLFELDDLLKASLAVRDTDSKLDMFISDLRDLEEQEPGRKILVFSYFKPTLHYLSRKLSAAGMTNMVMTGDFPPVRERLEYIEKFRNDPTVRVLLSSEVGSEGLDLQFCGIIVNYDLPWNPMVVEQRIGRLDRLGQQADRILIYNYAVQDTIEDRILRRLYKRIGIFERSIGDLEAILGGEMTKLTQDLLTSRLTPEEQENRIAEVADLIVKKQKDMEELEKSSSRLVANDQFFTDEIERVRNKRRYVSGPELEVFLREFFKSNFPRTTLTPANSTGIGRIENVQEIADFVRQVRVEGDAAAVDFLARVGGKRGLDVTFEAETALQRRSLEFLTMYHPVPQAIVRFYEDHQDQMHPISAVGVSGRDIQTSQVTEVRGTFLFELALLESTGFRPGQDLDVAFVSLERGQLLTEDQSESLLSAMVASGKRLSAIPQLPNEDLDRLVHVMDEEIVRRIQRRREELRRTNEAIIKDRLDSLTRSYEAKASKKESLLEQATKLNREQRYIRMLKGGLRNLKTAYLERRADLERNRDCDIDFRPLAAGLVRVD